VSTYLSIRYTNKHNTIAVLLAKHIVPQLLAAIQREADLWVKQALETRLHISQSNTLASLWPRRAEALLQIM
jgi:hypothetical protein